MVAVGNLARLLSRTKGSGKYRVQWILEFATVTVVWIILSGTSRYIV